MIVFLLIIFFRQIHSESIRIIEDLPIGTSIYTFSTERCSSSFRFVDHQKNFNDYFLIDPFTGRVTTKKLLDREEFCYRRMCSCSHCEISLEVLCLHRGEIFFNELKILIDDRNDHSPTFSKSFIQLDVLENVPIGYFIPIDVAIDLDYGENSIQKYRLIEENSTNPILDAFQLEYSKKNDLLALRLLKLLDRELCSRLQYTIEVSDGGKPYPRTTRMTVQLNVVDVNDMSPIFDHSDLFFNLSESTSIGSLIGRVHATDRDIGPNGLINYTIISIDPSSSLTKNLFSLSTQSGEIYLDGPLDFEKEKFYRIQIKAQDNGPQQGSTPSYVNVHINVQDENDNSPLIIPMFNHDPSAGVEYLINTNVIRIRENLPNGTFLGHISISDLDQGENGRLTCELNSSEAISMKSLLKNEAFLLFTERIFDREVKSSFSIDLNVFDHGEPRRSTNFHLTLLIIDENDERPEFDRQIYSLNISEATPVNTTLMRFVAIDRDEPETNNSKISFRLVEKSENFDVDSISGDLRLISPLDREKRDKYEFEVVAFDHGFPRSLSSTSRCIVHLVDVNDHSPRFNRSNFHFNVPETWPIEKAIGEIYADDLDNDFHQIHYRLNASSSIPFALMENGTLILTKPLDFERISSYQFEIIAEDNGGLSSGVSVTISIENRNDFCPELINSSTVLFYNTDQDENSFDFEIFDGDNDTCQMELMNFRSSFRFEKFSRNLFRLFAREKLVREYYRLEFQLYDLIDEKNDDQTCLRTIEFLLTTGSNETNRSLAIEIAQEYFFALKTIERRSSSSFHLTLINLILLFVVFLVALLVSFLALKWIFYRKKRPNQLYRFQCQTETQFPLLDDERQKQMRDSGYDDQWMTVSYSSSADRSTSIYQNRHLKTFSMS